jgi:hypothetical protein
MNRAVLPNSSYEEHMLGPGFHKKHSREQEKANTCGLPLIIEAINQINLRQIGGEITDSPTNDWTTLFQTVPFEDSCF